MLTDAEPNAAPPRPCPVGVRWDRQTLQLRDEEVFGSGKAELCARFLHRVFSIQEVQHVRIDRPRSTAEIRYAPGKLGMAELLQRLADAIRGTAVTHDGAAAGEPDPPGPVEAAVHDPSPSRPADHVGGDS